MSETDPLRSSAALELLTLFTGGTTAPPAPASASAGPAAGLAVSARLRTSADREQQLRQRSDLRDRLTDGIVELRKRRQVATQRAAGPADPESRLAAMARRAAERAGHPLA
ncbi:hypothetical protein ACIA8F_08400 [Streptomyces sp. NPDC051563]|uniref:hypothetical protein n=1 Tax=Streptomyces sp. NPDC051563 TaxID=3365659 RepID=UPI00379A69FF